MKIGQRLALPMFARALRSRSFALLWLGQTISILGDGAFFIALTWQVLLTTNSAKAIGLVEGIQTLPGLLILLLGGVAADRLPRRLILIYSDAGRGLVVLALALLAWNHMLQFWHFIVLALLFGCVDGFFWPASQAILPQLVAAEDLASANSLLTLSQRLSLIAGPLLAISVVTWMGTDTVFAFEGLTFLFSALCLLAIRLPGKGDIGEQPEKKLRHERYQAIKETWSDMLEGLRFVRSVRWLRLSTLFSAISNMTLAASLGAAEPRLIRDVYGAGIWLMGLIGAMISLGVILATVLLGQLPRLRRRAVLAYLGTLLMGLALSILGLPLARLNPGLIASPVSLLYGLGMGTSNLLWTTLTQEYVPEEKLGRVGSIGLLSVLGLTPLGLALGGLLTDTLGASLVFIACGLANVLLTLIAIRSRDIYRLD